MKRPHATRASWKTEPLPEQHARLELDLSFTLADMQRIKHGLAPSLPSSS